MSARYLSNTSTTLWCPLWHAALRAVLPSPSQPSTVAPCSSSTLVIIKETLLINHYDKNKLANYFWNFNCACRFLMITYYCFYVLCICYNSWTLSWNQVIYFSLIVSIIFRVSTIKLHTLNVNKIWWPLERRNFDISVEWTKNKYFFTKSFGRQWHNLCLIILKIPILTTWITGSKKVRINFDFEKKRNNYHFFIRLTYLERKITWIFFIYKMFSNKSFQVQVTWNYLKKKQKVDFYQSKIMRHKLCNCLPKLLVKKYLFFVLSNNMSKFLLS